jgi:hypothetical protein
MISRCGENERFREPNMIDFRAAKHATAPQRSTNFPAQNAFYYAVNSWMYVYSSSRIYQNVFSNKRKIFDLESIQAAISTEKSTGLSRHTAPNDMSERAQRASQSIKEISEAIEESQSSEFDYLRRVAVVLLISAITLFALCFKLPFLVHPFDPSRRYEPTLSQIVHNFIFAHRPRVSQSSAPLYWFFLKQHDEVHSFFELLVNNWGFFLLDAIRNIRFPPSYLLNIFMIL